MTSQVRKALIQSFEERTSSLFPKMERDGKTPIPSGWRSYRVKLADNITGFIILNIIQGEDRFTIEVAVSRSDIAPPSARNGPADALGASGIYFRIHKLWAKDGRDHWWWIGTEPAFRDRISVVTPTVQSRIVDNDAVRRSVDSALDALTKYVVPYFERIVEMNRTSQP